MEFGIINGRLKPVFAAFYHPVRRSGVHPSYSRRGALGIWNLESGIWNLELQTAGQGRYSQPSTTPSAEAAAGHPLRGLIREGDAAEIAQAFAEIPLDKINEARELLEGLKNSD